MNEQLTREQVLQMITGVILDGNARKARYIIKEVKNYELMTGRYVLSSITMRDILQAIEELEIGAL